MLAKIKSVFGWIAKAFSRRKPQLISFTEEPDDLDFEHYRLMTANEEWTLYQVFSLKGMVELAGAVWGMDDLFTWETFAEKSNVYVFSSNMREDRWRQLFIFCDLENKKVYLDLDFTFAEEPPPNLGLPAFDFLITKAEPGILVDGRKYPPYSLPDGLCVQGDLNLIDVPIAYLPRGLVVRGSLDIEGTEITSLPKDLRVGGDFFLFGSKVREIPEGLEVGGNLNLILTNVKALPRRLRVHGCLNLVGTSVKKLPDDLFVGRVIYVNDPKQIECSKRLRSQLG